MEDFFRNNIREYALLFIDKEFLEGDFASFIYKRLFDIDVNDIDNSIIEINDIELGDLLIFDEGSGIYMGDKKFIHMDKKRIIISDLDNYWLSRLVGTKDVIGQIKKTMEI